jgi:hypothetical protein
MVCPPWLREQIFEHSLDFPRDLKSRLDVFYNCQIHRWRAQNEIAARKAGINVLRRFNPHVLVVHIAGLLDKGMNVRHQHASGIVWNVRANGTDVYQDAMVASAISGYGHRVIEDNKQVSGGARRNQYGVARRRHLRASLFEAAGDRISLFQQRETVALPFLRKSQCIE